MLHNFQFFYDSHFLFQVVGKNNSKIKVMLKAIEKYATALLFNTLKNVINPTLALVIFKRSIRKTIKKFGENYFHHQEYVCMNLNVLSLAKKKRFFPMTIEVIFIKYRESLPTKNKIYKSLTSSAISNKNYEHALDVWSLV